MPAASTTVATAKNAPQRRIRSLALSVYFKNPDFGMKQYEILSRATAFLLGVDPFYEPPRKEGKESKYDHLGSSEKRRAERNLKRSYALEPAAGPPGRTPQELGWLEFCPTRHRPIAHCVASSHVLAPWRWKQYYPQEWVSHIEPKHCAYSLEVICPTKPDEPLAKYALNPYPIHHPDGLDLAVIHLKQEETAMKHMKSLGVETLHLRDLEKNQPFKDEELNFEGFQIAETDLAESSDDDCDWEDGNDRKQKAMEDDTRVFFPYTTTGQLLFGSADRFLASTPKPLPQGLCGGPILDVNNRVVGVVEGIVPISHEDKRIAGRTAFIPSMKVREFLDNYAERLMLEQIMPKELFEKVVRLKKGLEYHEKEKKFTLDGDSIMDEKEQMSLHAVLDDLVRSMRSHHSDEEVEAIRSIIRSERDQVLDILNREGGDVDEIISRVRAQTRATQEEAIKKLMEEQITLPQNDGEKDDANSASDATKDA